MSFSVEWEVATHACCHFDAVVHAELGRLAIDMPLQRLDLTNDKVASAPNT